ncbi:hypothetical protein [Baekduia alba]|nr:hypothetical protein [Baekduia alba]
MRFHLPALGSGNHGAPRRRATDSKVVEDGAMALMNGSGLTELSF